MTFIKNISTPDTTDLELIVAYKQTSDIKLMGTLYERYMELVYGVCLKYLKSTEPAKDAVMQIFEEVLVKVLKYDIANFRSWLHTLAKNYCLMQLRSPKNLKTIAFDAAFMQSGEETHLDVVMNREEDLKKMEHCLEQLSGEQKESVELFYLQNKCYKEISTITGRELNKVRSLIQNGKRNLKICMETNAEIKI